MGGVLEAGFERTVAGAVGGDAVDVGAEGRVDSVESSEEVILGRDIQVRAQVFPAL
jgi:hypothetical protein